MSLRERFREATALGKLSLLFNLLANILSWIAFTNTTWGISNNSSTDVGYGLWRICSNVLGLECVGTVGIRLDWYGAVQAFCIFGFLGINITLILIFLYLFYGRYQQGIEISFWGAILCFVSAGCYLLSVIVFGAMYTSNGIQDLSWSFALAVVAVAFEAGTGLVLLIDGYRARTTLTIS